MNWSRIVRSAALWLCGGGFLGGTTMVGAGDPKTEAVQLAKTSAVSDVEGKSFDVIVVGGTPCGIACAVRAAREGASVLLVNHTGHLGGMMTNGLMQWDALYGGSRAPLFSELLRNIENYYRTVFGEDSKDFKTVRFSQEKYPTGWAEPHVAEREFNRLIAAEKNLKVVVSCDPTAVERAGDTLKSVTLRATSGGNEVHISAKIFVDATYEGDLLALAKVPYRVGREARSEFSEPHAGKLFTNIDHAPSPTDAVEGRLNIHPYNSRQGSIDSQSPFSADKEVQAYNYRCCVTKDPANRVMLTEPPPGYRREEYLHYERKSIATNAGPNLKSHMNSPILPGENRDYPEGDWTVRDKITERHLNFALGLIWFLQNDESISEKAKKQFREWGLPKDEFTDHHHVPYEMYVREARRLDGRYVFTEHDGSLSKDYARTPVHEDSIAITDWYMDSHSCTNDSRPGFRYDGKLILTEESRPSQVPYRCMLAKEVNNLLVPLCLSTTHVSWGCVRLEPVWMETGEAAGVAAALSLKANTAPAELNSDQLVRTLCNRRFMVSFFNDVHVDDAASWVPAVEYWGTKGFFSSYDARPNDPLTMDSAGNWLTGVVELLQGELKVEKNLRRTAALPRAENTSFSAEKWADIMQKFRWPLDDVTGALEKARPETIRDPQHLSRAEACEWLFRFVCEAVPAKHQ